jgi:hypothetical protein
VQEGEEGEAEQEPYVSEEQEKEEVVRVTWPRLLTLPEPPE